MLILDHTYDAKRFSPLVYDPKVIDHYKNLKEGTLAYDDFWGEQDYNCLNGFKPKGMNDITGEHYFYLNMNKIEMLPEGARRKKKHAPYYRELDNRLFHETFEAKRDHYNLIIGKPRRVGLSWFGTNQIVYEMLFNEANKTGICAGKQDKADSFYAKVLYLFDNIRDEYKVSRLKKDDKILRLGFHDLINKQKVDSGLLSEMLVRTMFVDSAGFEGESLSLVIFEEAGLFQNLIQSFKSTEPCFKDGANQFGTALIYGTGGEIDKGAKGYMDMWNNAHAYNCKKIFIPACEFYPGDGEPDKNGNKTSFFDIKTGRTNEEAAKKHILAERERAKGSKEGYIKHIQSYPLKESEIFIKTTGGLLDRALLNDQYQRWSNGDCPYDLRTGRLEWVDDEITAMLVTKSKNTKEACRIRISRGSKVIWKNDENGPIKKIADPINKDGMEHKPDIAGCDSYDEEVEEGTGSLGATVVYRTYAGPSKDYNMPIAVLNERGDSSNDDVFYENNVKMAVYYNYELLFEYSKIAIEGYFKDVGAEKYLKVRPDLRKEILNSKAKNEYGMRMPKEVKQLVTKLLKREVKENVGGIWFDNLLIDLMDYGDKNTDMAMAMGLCLIYKLELFDDIVDDFEDEDYYGGDNVLDSMVYYDIDESGNVKIKTYGTYEEYDYMPDPHERADDEEVSEKEKIAKIKQRKADAELRASVEKNLPEARKKSLFDLLEKEILRASKLD